PVSVRYGCPLSFRSISALVTNGLGSGRPNAGPKLYSVIMLGSSVVTERGHCPTDELLTAWCQQHGGSHGMHQCRTCTRHPESTLPRPEPLLQTIQVLRRHRRPVTAQAIAAELEVSVRTVYRDIVALQGDRVPLRGEAGIGYVLDDGFDLPPLMFDANEIEAVVLRLRWGGPGGGPPLPPGPPDVVPEGRAVVPARLKPPLS